MWTDYNLQNDYLIEKAYIFEIICLNFCHSITMCYRVTIMFGNLNKNITNVLFQIIFVVAFVKTKDLILWKKPMFLYFYNSI